MEESIAKDYRKGLSSLKEISEGLDESQTSEFNIEKINFEAKNFLIKRETVNFDEVQSFYERNLQEIYSYINTTENLKINGNSSGIYFSWNEEEMNTDMAAAVPFSLGDESVSLESLDFEVKELSGEAYKLAFYGDYEKLASAHEAIHKYLEKNNIEMYEVALEEYVTGPAEDSNPENWLTNIYYFKK